MEETEMLHKDTVVLDTTQPQPDGQNKAMIIFECPLCPAQFVSAQECFRHEKRRHIIERVQPKRSYNIILNGMQRIVNSKKRKDVHERLSAATPDKKLDSLCEFYAMSKENIALVRERVIKSLRKAIYDQYNVYVFGSILSELALQDSDIDLYLKPKNVFTRTQYKLHFKNVSTLLRRSPVFENIICIKRTRVPIIKCVCKETGFSLDLNVSSVESEMNSRFLRDLVHWDKRLQQILLFMKIWAKQLQIIGHNHMSSHCLITLVLFFLQQTNILKSIKELQETEPPHIINGINFAYNIRALNRWPEDVSVFHLICQCFIFYQRFDFQEFLVSPFLGVALPLEEVRAAFPDYKAEIKMNGNRYIHVQDPFCLNHNIGKSFDFSSLTHFRDCISNAVDLCIGANTPNGISDDIYERLLFEKLEEFVKKSGGGDSKNPWRRKSHAWQFKRN